MKPKLWNARRLKLSEKLRKREDRRAEVAGIRTEGVDSFRHIFEVIDVTVEKTATTALAEVDGAEVVVEMTTGRRVEATDMNLEEEALEIATTGPRAEETIDGAAIDEETIVHRVVASVTEGMIEGTIEGTIEGHRHRAMLGSPDGKSSKNSIGNNSHQSCSCYYLTTVYENHHCPSLKSNCCIHYVNLLALSGRFRVIFAPTPLQNQASVCETLPISFVHHCRRLLPHAFGCSCSR